jgi:phosphatidylserine/phosphatidylglycerophosphate/cardiolipin synthase-like enzyme
MIRLGAMVPAGTALTLVTPRFAVPGASGTDPPARYAGVRLLWLHVPPSVPVLSFARASQRIYAHLAPGPGTPVGAGVLLELSPLPGFIAGALLELPGGAPVQYVLLDGADASAVLHQDDDSLVMVEEPLVTPTQGAWLTLCFQDRVCRDPRAWSLALDGAAQAGGVERSAAWQGFLTSVAATSGPRVRLLDHTGRPSPHTAVQITTGGITHDVTTDNDGDTGVDVVGGAAEVTIAGAGALLASADSDNGVLGATLTLTADDRHVLVSKIDDWLAPRTPGVVATDAKRLPDWSAGNTFEPIVDGIPYFERLVQDLRAAKGGGAVELADWDFVIESLDDKTKPWSLLPEDDSTQILNLLDELITGGAQALVLVNRFEQTTQAELETLRADVAIALVAAGVLLGILDVAHALVVDIRGWVLLAAGLTLIPALPDAQLLDLVVALAEPSSSAVDAINQAHPGTAVWTPYPAALADNPLAPTPLTIGGVRVDEVVAHVGVYHHKIAIAKPPGGDPVAYLGGIDIDPNRVDGPLHRAAFPFHDVQVRLTGPAADDVVRTVAERATYHGATPPIAPADDPSSLHGDGPHVVQVSRTYFAPGAGSTTKPFPTALHGEHTTHETVLKAIANAREYIYIEDQYFTPDKQVVGALVAAGSRPGLQLVVTLVEDNGQLLGALRRNDVVHALIESWGARFRIGTPLRRHLDPEPATFGGLGRMVLRKDVGPGEDTVFFGPSERCPAPPFWAFVESELVRVDSVVANGAGTGPVPGGNPSPDDPNQTWQQVNVRRSPGSTSGSPGWGAKPDNHDEGSCVLAVQVPAIYVHAKLIIVDDVFVGIGSTNANRRSMEHDGEIHAFAISPSLKRDPGNPALRLRCRLWAEHLGLPPELGLSLLADPVSSLAYFDRSWYRGSRWQPLQTQSATDPPAVAIPVLSSAAGILLGLAAGVVAGDVDRDNLWASFVEPTTLNDPNVDPLTDKGPLL